MRNSKQCPKCQSTEIAVSTGTSGSDVNTILTGISYFGAVPCDKYICLECGYIEQWVHNEKGLEKIARKCRRL